MEHSNQKPGRFLSGILKVAGGGVAGQAIVLLTMPVLARLYDPRDFGVLAVFTGLTVFLTAISALRLDMAIPLPDKPKQAADLTFLSLFLVLITSLVAALGVKWFGVALSGWVGAPELVGCLVLLPAAVFGAGCCQVLTSWTARRKDFVPLGASRTLQLAGQAAAQLGGGVARIGPLGLVFGFVVGPFLGLFLLLARSGLSAHRLFSKDWGSLFLKYRNFFLFTALAALIDVASLQLSTLLFARYFSLEVAGYFSLAMRALSAPGLLIGGAIAQVFYPIAAEHDRSSTGAKDLVEKTAAFLCLLSLAIFPLIAIHGPAIFEIVFGEKWKQAGLFARYLSPFLMFSFTASPVCTVLFIMGHQRQSLIFSIVTAVSWISVILIGAKFESSMLAVALFSAVSVVLLTCYLARVFQLVGSSMGTWIRQIRAFLFPGVVLIAALYCFSLILPPIASFCVSVVVMGAFLFRFRDRMLKDILHV